MSMKCRSGDAPNGGHMVSHEASETNTTRRSTRACQRRLAMTLTATTSSPAQQVASPSPFRNTRERRINRARTGRRCRSSSPHYLHPTSRPDPLIGASSLLES
ncbi:hypothetical protein K443DRAFT_475368 [Laccaria amethystina LaAM-08-1]|uniref:Uncharacterized protein n=1 Tax=Laccaria amethystina LaAM-08-1 TaxID=1095629 RepID=A0A0C9WHR4_9AGAR|nr:hypothetical protein K443DRAFT_475368 [Laccaria amethystina LaAM-08-1]